MDLSNELSLVEQVVKNSAAQPKQLPPPQRIFKPTVTGEGFSEAEEVAEEISEPLSGLNEEFSEPEFSEGETASFDRPEDNFENFEESEDDFSEEDKERNFIYSKLYVGLIDTGLVTVCQLLSKESSKIAEDEYGLSSTKQGQLTRALADVLNHERKKKSPRSALMMLFIGLLLPPLMKAGKVAIKRRSEKKKKKIKKARVSRPMPQDSEVIITPFTGKGKTDSKPDLSKVPEAEFTIDEPIKVNPLFEEHLASKSLKPKKASTANGRQKGARKNPKTKKMEMYTHEDSEFFYYSWGHTVRKK